MYVALTVIYAVIARISIWMRVTVIFAIIVLEYMYDAYVIVETYGHICRDS